MPYYVFEMPNPESKRDNTPTFLQAFEVFKEAKNFARSKRAELNVSDPDQVKIMFADSEDEAKARLGEKREAPILREWEK